MSSLRIAVDFGFVGADEAAVARFAWLAEGMGNPTRDEIISLAEQFGLHLEHIQAFLTRRNSRPVWAK